MFLPASLPSLPQVAFVLCQPTPTALRPSPLLPLLLALRARANMRLCTPIFTVRQHSTCIRAVICCARRYWLRWPASLLNIRQFCAAWPRKRNVLPAICMGESFCRVACLDKFFPGVFFFFGRGRDVLMVGLRLQEGSTHLPLQKALSTMLRRNALNQGSV